MDARKRWFTGMLSTEDWWAVWIGLFFVLMGLFAAASGIDSTGWIIKFSKWVDLSKAFGASSAGLLAFAKSSLVLGILPNPFTVSRFMERQAEAVASSHIAFLDHLLDRSPEHC